MSEVVSQKVTRQLRCNLTAKEIETYGRDIATALAQFEASEAKKKEVAAQIKAESEGYRNKALGLTRLINNGYEYRDIECTETKNFPQGLYIVVRDDTLEEVVKRALTGEERQVEFADDETEGEGEEPLDETKDPDYPESPEDPGQEPVEPGEPEQTEAP